MKAKNVHTFELKVLHDLLLRCFGQKILLKHFSHRRINFVAYAFYLGWGFSGGNCMGGVLLAMVAMMARGCGIFFCHARKIG